MSANMKIVADSSSDVLRLEAVPYAAAPLKIMTEKREYVDNDALDVEKMVEDFRQSSEKSHTACPNVDDWLSAFGDAQYVFCVTITSGLSGSYNAACIAAQEYEDKNPDRKVFVIDSLSAGPELKLIIEKLEELIKEGKSFEEICDAIKEYQKHTGLLFMLESLKNLANNGRVSKIVASAAGILGIRVLGKASDKGELEQLVKSRGENRALPTLTELLGKLGYAGGKVRISHCCNENAANKLKALILEKFSKAQVEIYKARGLCSFYAEKGGLLVGFEKCPAR
ncbi:MAG: DegV family protein [Oscillospiraceae bacterium]|nr:DegV family protein [Oscillospiraceae bacterium]